MANERRSRYIGRMPQIDLGPDDYRAAVSRRGAPIDFGRPSPSETRKQTNPLIWGAVAGTIAALLVVISPMIGSADSENPLLQNPVSAFGGTFFWGWLAGNIKASLFKPKGY